jgi:hypothetical protein
MNRSLLLLVSCAILCWSAAAFADKPVSIKGKAPPPEPAPEQAKTTEAQKPFDYSELGARDAAAEKAVAKVKERCVADPMSREGPTAEEQARCNLAVARLVGLGKKGAPSILAALDEVELIDSYYAVNRLLFTLGKIDDKKVRRVFVDGFATIAKEESDAQVMLAYQLPETLEAMLGASPPVDVPWDTAAVTDAWEENRKTAARWSAFLDENADKTRKQIAAAHLAKAKKEKADEDPIKAYRAIEHLVDRAPFEAFRAAKAYAGREGLEKDVADGFESLMAQAEWRIEEQNAKAAASRPAALPKSRS